MATHRPGQSGDDTAVRVAVAAVVRRADGRYLLVRRAQGRPAAGYWTPVTGRPEPGESLADAARREVREEVGLVVRVGEEIHRCPAEGAPWNLVWLEAHLEDESTADALRLQDSEVAEALWLTATDAARLEPMFTATRESFLSTVVAAE